MTSPVIDDDAAEELRMLRARAYGPRADISELPGGLARLRELEELSRPVRPTEVAPPAVLPPAESTAPEGEAVASATEPSVPPAPASVQPRAAWQEWVARHRRWVWALSLLAAFAIGGTGVLTSSGGFPRVADAQEVAVLAVDPNFDAPDMLGSAPREFRGFEEFSGMSVITTQEEWPWGGAHECMVVAEGGAESAAVEDRSFFTGCGVDAFPATVQFDVEAGMPTELIERFPLGTSLQFVAEDAGVRVRMSQP